MRPRIAVVSFPGNNCEVESMRALKQSGMAPVFLRWNADVSRLTDIDGYFLPGGFAYEDRGRAGMVAARDSVMEFIKAEATEGKAVIGNCNGAQVLVESGLIPFGNGLQMSLARNAIKTGMGWQAQGFLSEWIWMTPSCSRTRCATSGWRGAMHLPIAHGEGRFTTKDRDLLKELSKNNQIAFSYCDAKGNVSADPAWTPNGSEFAIAGICNPAGNVVAIMPHPERTPNGKPYFDSLREWIVRGGKEFRGTMEKSDGEKVKRGFKPPLNPRKPKAVEIFIDTLITNNEERTVERTARKFAPSLMLKQWKYFSVSERAVKDVLRDLSAFNPNKERAFIRRNGRMHHWDSARKKEETAHQAHHDLFEGISLLRRDIPDTGAAKFGNGSQTGICYTCKDVSEKNLFAPEVLEVLANPHASTLERL